MQRILFPFGRALALVAAAFALSVAAVPAPALAAKAETYTGVLGHVAVGGYDAVSFFTGAPVKGSDANKITYKGAIYQFATAENAAKFKANPGAYAPQYGGYCAWAAAQGKTAPGDPKYWRVVNGKLYLNYNGDIQKKWEKDIPGFIAKGDANWPKILK
ncbi:MAG: YHS domain-containing (seleno)protein [Caulobacterales bacterium]